MTRPVLLAVVAVLVTASEVEAQPLPPPITPLRHDESYAYLAGRDTLDARARTPLDAVKYVSFGRGVWGRGGSFVTVGGEVRQRVEALANARLVRGTDDAWLLHRYAASADVQLGSRLRLFAQLYAAAQTGAVQPGPLGRDDASIHEAFVEAVPVEGPAGRVAVRVGREERSLGTGRLLSLREGPNVRASFEVAHVLASRGASTVDVFVQRPLEVDPGAFDDAAVPGEWSWGAYGTAPLSPALAIDAYYVGFTTDAAFDRTGPRASTRHTLGGRLVTARGAPLTVDVEAALQLGSVEASALAPAGRVVAGLVGAGVAYRFDAVPLRPDVGVLFDLASGDRDAADPDVQTFETIEPNNAYFGLAGLVGGFKNLLHLKPRLILTAPVADGLTVEATWSVYWRASTADAAYTPGRTPAFGLEPGTPLPTARLSAHQPSVEAALQIQRYVGVGARMSWFVPGPYARALVPGATTQRYGSVTALVRF